MKSLVCAAALAVLPVGSAFAQEAPAGEPAAPDAPQEPSPDAARTDIASPDAARTEPEATGPVPQADDDEAEDDAASDADLAALAGSGPSSAGPSVYQPQGALGLTASAGPQRKYTLTFNPLALLFGEFNAELEITTSPKATFFVGPSYIGADVTSSGSSVSVSAVGLSTGMRFFTQPTAPAGFWIGPRVDLAYVTVESDGSEGSAVGFGLGALLGYTWITASNFDFSLGIGAAYRQIEAEVDGETSGVSGFGLMGRVSLGFAF